MFTVPPGGDGAYYFSTFLYGDKGEFSFYDMMLNNEQICSARPDHSIDGSSDYTTGSCRAVVSVTSGNMYLISTF